MFQCIKCGRCCENTEMILLREDIERIASLGFKTEDFVVYNKGFHRLKNINGKCVFLNPKTRLCSIYDWRPKGCKLYPIIYVVRSCFEEITVDNNCPQAHTVDNNDVKLAAPQIADLVSSILRERICYRS
ncbi:MAG: YkgJ family cysteine cluster protein [Candidatus Methanomethylicia archaeon]